MKPRTHLLLVGLLCGLAIPSFATHFQSFELWAKHVTGTQYEIYSGQYFDCSGAAFSPYIPLGTGAPSPFQYSFSSFPCQLSVDSAFQVVTIMEVTPVCPGQTSNCINPTSPIPGTAYVRYKELVTFTNCGVITPSTTITLSQFSCCRTNAITTLNNGGSQGVAMTLTIRPYYDNNSPELEPINLTICDGESGSFYVGGVDADFDSLNYTLVAPQDNIGVPVQYATGFSSTQPLGSGWNVSLDSQTGVLSVSPTTGGIQFGVIGVQIDEYRNGNLVGTVFRDLSLTTRWCGGPVNDPPTIQSVSNVAGGNLSAPDVIDYCLGSTLTFDVIVDDMNAAQTLSFKSSIDKVLPGATVTSSGSNPMTISVSWTSTAADTANRHLFISAEDDNCDITGQSSEVIFLTSTGKCIFPSVTGTNCQDSTGAISVTVGGGTGPFAYLWNTGATTSGISNLPIGTYWVTVTDSGTSSVFSDTFLLAADDVIISASSTDPDCDGTDGSIALSVSGGFPPYSYGWNTGATTDSIGGLSPGGYSVIVTDSLGCFQQYTEVLDPADSCFVTIMGTVYHDLNGNCMMDPGEYGLPGVLIDLIPGGMVLTDSAGNYTYQVDTVSTTVKVKASYLQGQYCPDSVVIAGQSFGDLVPGVNFGVDAVLSSDLAVYLTSTPAVWNGTVTYTVVGSNLGTLAINGGQKTLSYPAGLTFVGAFPAPSQIDTVNNTITWNTGLLVPGNIAPCLATFALDTTLNLGDTLQASAVIAVQPGETDSLNNSASISQIVVGAYDPNDKQPTPAGIGEPGFILYGTSTIDYKIRFQNTGNYPATFVVLRDTLSTHLDLSQYRTLGFSHPFTLSVEEDSIMVFTFANINLPDSTSDPDGSQGFVAFQIGIDQNAPVGTEINNQAAIYFDFNPPIFTNTTRSTLYTQPEVAVEAQSLYCVGDEIASAITATGMPPYNYAWSSGKNTTKNDLADTTLVFQSGWYVLTVTDEFGFTATDSILVDVTPGPLADFTWAFTGNGFEVTFADSSQNGNSYFWDFGVNGTFSTDPEPTFVFPSDGVYDIKMAVTNECGTDTAYATIEIRNSGLDQWPLGPVSIYPNPATDLISLELPIHAEWTFRLMDTRGKILNESQQRGDQTELSMESLSPGIYLIEISGDGYRTFQRVVKR